MDYQQIKKAADDLAAAAKATMDDQAFCRIGGYQHTKVGYLILKDYQAHGGRGRPRKSDYLKR